MAESTFQRLSDLSDNSEAYKRFHFYGTFDSVNRLPLMNTIEFKNPFPHKNLFLLTADIYLAVQLERILKSYFGTRLQIDDKINIIYELRLKR